MSYRIYVHTEKDDRKYQCLGNNECPQVLIDELKKQNPKERQNNLKKAFIVRQNDVKLKKVVLVDDIYTTGNTANECAKILKESGIYKVGILTIAKD